MPAPGTATAAASNTATATDRQILLTPGPTAVPPQVLAELAEPIIHHRTKRFQAIFAELSAALQKVLRTEGPVLSIAGSGTTSYEAAQLCLATPGSKVLAVAGGKFGERWQDIYDVYAKHLGLEVLKISHAWGEPAPVDQIKALLDEHEDISAVSVVHSETSTATKSDVQAIAAITREHANALLIVDGITSVGAFPCEMDAWGIDCLVTGSQKAMMLPPGLGYVGLGPRAVARLTGRGDQLPGVPAYNLDLRKWLKSHAGNDVPFTPPVSLIRGQKVACELILADGLDAVHARTAKLQQATLAAFDAMGIKPISTSPSPSVTGGYYPDGVDDKVRGKVRDNHGVHLAGGQDGRGATWKGKIFRISHMGFVDADDTRAGLTAIETEFIAAGATIEPGTAVAAFDASHG